MHGIIDRRWPVLRWMKLMRQTEYAKHGSDAPCVDLLCTNGSVTVRSNQ
ncbi:hypothetical protein ACFU98_31065 [Streptomyces sp. NPDC057575]